MRSRREMATRTMASTRAMRGDRGRRRRTDGTRRTIDKGGREDQQKERGERRRRKSWKPESSRRPHLVTKDRTESCHALPLTEACVREPVCRRPSASTVTVSPRAMGARG